MRLVPHRWLSDDRRTCCFDDRVADETTDIGHESGTTVTPDYTSRDSRFTGKIHWVQIDLGDDNHDHFIDPDERLRIAMATQ